jgi:GTP-binding protein EngB required for normal cell division
MVDVAGDAIRRYDALKLEVAAIAQTAMLQCQKSKDAEGERVFQQLLARLAEDRFNLAVVGPFSRGKSSLMNAILGFDGLPTGILPHTSVITTVSYGPQERVLVRCDGWSLAEEIRLEQLAEYVTEQGNPGNQRRVALAEIELPAEILRHGLHFIDTPGLGSAIVANTETTERFLPEIDAAIFVSSFDFALSEADIEFLRRVRATVGVVFFVLNKLDLVSESEREEVVRFVRDRLDRELGVGRYALFAVSAKRGLEAKLHGDSAGLTQSGLDELEVALAAFMAGDKTRQLAVRVMDRLIALLQRELMHAGFAPTTDRQVSGVLDKFDEDLAMLNIRRAELVSSLETLGNDALRAIEPRINSAFANLKQSAARKFGPEFSAATILSKPDAVEAFARSVLTFCERALARELRVYEAALNEHLERSAGAVLAQISALPDELFTIAMNGDGSGREISSPRAEKSEAAPPDVAIAGMTHLNWSPCLPWWVYVAPARWFPAPMIKRFTVALDELLTQCRSNVDATIRCGMNEYLDRMGRETVTRIDANAARIKGALLSNGSGENRGVFEELLDRARNLQRQFDDEGDRRTLPETDCSNGSDVTVARSVSAVPSMRACPICGAVVQAVLDFLGKLQYELSMDGEAQHEHAEAGGFCPVHTWLYANLTSPLGVSRAYPSVLKARAAQLSDLSRGAETLEELLSGLGDSSGLHPVCSVCALAGDARDKAIAEMLKGLVANDAQATPSVCLPHLHPALRRCADLKSGRELVGECSRVLDRVADDMRRYALKRDAMRRNLTTADEREAYQVGLSKLAGDRRLAFAQREDDRL